LVILRVCALHRASEKFQLDEAKREISKLQESMQILINDVEERDRLLQFTREEIQRRERLEEQNRASLLETKLLKNEICSIKSECIVMKDFYEDRLSHLHAKQAEYEEERLQMEIDFWVEMESQKQCQAEKLSSITSALKRTKATLSRREKKLQNLVKTPHGYRSIVKPRRDLASLAPRGGQAKRIIRLARSIINPATTGEIQTANSVAGSRRRLLGSKETQRQTGQVLASVFSQIEVSAMCESTQMNAVGVRMANYYMDKIGEKIGANEILETCDRNGITHRGYGAIYKQFKGAAKSSGRGLRIGCLPNPHKISIARSLLNLKLQEYVGEYYPIISTLKASPTGNNKEHVLVSLNEYNSLFTDVEQVQRTMVELYGITPQGCKLLISFTGS
jgi:hypothetical protein